jgi:AcrR family transcriptional regulator
VPRPSDTKQRIQDVARELFAEKGVQKTSLQEIAKRLGITKPALYYHFASREELVRSIVQPLVDNGEEFVSRLEARTEVDPRALLEGYFDFIYGHREEIVFVLTEMTTLTELGLITLVLGWRERLTKALFGPAPPVDLAIRATVALGGLQDCSIAFPELPAEEVREAAVNAACAALGITT